ncbi:protein S100-A6-like [Anabas testudineus]|uniref:protein S100-A6-like n=1 Tax=Anabas testudineus TaxID=64144 RepID=UPI000E453CDA|nr:protein S100-A6-like [Anabas testudineus]
MSCGGGSDCIKALMSLIGIFQKYASKDQDTDHLNKNELKELLQKEFPGLLNDSPKPEDVKEVMDALDQDKDGQVDIQEYFTTVCTLGIIYYEILGACPKK